MPQMSRSENLRQLGDFEIVREIGRRISIGPWAVLLLSLATGQGGDRARGAEAGPQAGIAVWDTVQPAANPIASGTLAARSGWAQVAMGETAAGFQGDAVLGNGRIAAVVRKQAAGVEVYGLGKGDALSRARLILLTAEGEPAARAGRAMAGAGPARRPDRPRDSGQSAEGVAQSGLP